MSRKRSLMPDVYRTRKRMCVATASNHNSQTSNSTTDSKAMEWNNGESSSNHHVTNHIDPSTIPNDTACALKYLKNLFPVDKFEGRLPPVILQHQLYSILNSRTLVDQQINALRNSGEIRLFRLGSETNEFCIVFTEDYKCHVKNFTQHMGISKTTIEKFFSTVVDQSHDISLNKQKMEDFKFEEEEITHLVKACVLTVRDVGSWWLAIPCAGIFMKSFMRGRKAALTMIRKCKYKEIAKEELKTHKLPRIAKLGMEYHIHDIIGADLVKCVPTSSGMLLRLQE